LLDFYVDIPRYESNLGDTLEKKERTLLKSRYPTKNEGFSAFCVS
jgi:hypothetical protein